MKLKIALESKKVIIEKLRGNSSQNAIHPNFGIPKMKKENEEIKKENEEIKKENKELKKENEELKKGNEEIKKENEKHLKTIENLKNKIANQTSNINGLMTKKTKESMILFRKIFFEFSNFLFILKQFEKEINELKTELRKKEAKVNQPVIPSKNEKSNDSEVKMLLSI